MRWLFKPVFTYIYYIQHTKRTFTSTIRPMLNYKKMFTCFIITLLLAMMTACGDDSVEELLVFTHATIWDGVSQTMQPNSALVTRDGRVTDIIDIKFPGEP